MTDSFIDPAKPALVLAPMEGVIDAPMREMMTRTAGISYCVTEFLRVAQDPVSVKTFLRHVPELKNSCRTSSGTAVQVQLLGGDPEKMAVSAATAVALGAKAIDINFGCPSPTVNRHDGGATLLKYPDRIESIVAAVRSAVPAGIPVSAKLRLGWDNPADIFANAERAERGGASWITIHARTKVQGYAPPAHWHFIGEVRKRVGIEVVANGDIWTLDDFKKCRDATKCSHFMLGRGALANPFLFGEIATELGMTASSATKFSQQKEQWRILVKSFADVAKPFSDQPMYTVCRIKQWLGFAQVKNEMPWVTDIKRAQSLADIYSILDQ